MKIHTLWGERKGFEGDAPELMVAWDECSIESNPDGFEDACREARTSWGSELVQERCIHIEVPESVIFDAFEPITTTGTAEVSE